ncbi:MAG: glucosaminidase domain-containing protein [Flavobacteriales bacterium]|jgi:hypothetical protein
MRQLTAIILALLAQFPMAIASGPGKLTALDYIQTWKEEAVYQMVVHRIPASITLAQGMLESGNGNSRLAVEGNNHFGIKCHSDWTGGTIHEDDETRGECFRKYTSARESFDDHSIFLKRKRYAPLFELDVDDYRQWARVLKSCGYATNPDYPQLLIRLVEAHRLDQYDKLGLEYIQKQVVPERSAGETPLVANTPEPRRREKSRSNSYDPDSGGEIRMSGGRTVALSDNHIRYIQAHAGETPESLAAELEMGAWQIRRYNDLKVGESLQEGDVVYLQPKRSRGSAASHTVKTGETLREISQRYGIRLKRLCRLNQLEADHMPNAGRILRLRP